MRLVSSDIFKNSLQGKTKKEYRQMSTMDTEKKKEEEEEEKAENNQIQKAKTTIFYHRNVNVKTKLVSNSTRNT